MDSIEPSDTDRLTVLFAIVEVNRVVDEHRPVVRVRVTQQVKHTLARGPVLVVTQLESHPSARHRVQPGDNLDVNLVLGGSVPRPHVVNP